MHDRHEIEHYVWHAGRGAAYGVVFGLAVWLIAGFVVWLLW